MEISIDIEGVESTIKLVTEENDKIAVLGQNGSGKTTFLKALSGLYVPPFSFPNRMLKILTKKKQNANVTAIFTRYTHI